MKGWIDVKVGVNERVGKGWKVDRERERERE